MSEAVATANGAPDAVRPVVRTAESGNLGLWLFGAVLLLAGFLVFQMLDSRRQELAQAGTAPGTEGGLIAAPPPLSLPPAYGEPLLDAERPLARAVRLPLPSQGAVPPPAVVTRVVERPAQLGPDELATIRANQIAAMGPPPQPEAFAPTVPPPPVAGGDRVSAGRLANPSFTVPKGTIVAAVLETALDSSRPGAVRAIVSRDVKSFDGSRVLIPRGSRLYGEYNADVSAGQKRALIRWQRLTRPDAVIVNLDSPAADPLGRAGVEGKVDSHFFARFGSAILQSVLDIGVGLATRSVNDDAVIVALPGSTQQVTGQLQPAQVQPTLRVRQGTSVSVFVQRDLDFSTVDR
ncbi:MAG TPA: TrbI/VirB10 family protein [Croceibacterium sp.]|nr:TrbI/VirB10 family protein [Solirubrobacterales bacterium]HYD24732.1 TrbI/VirB10 family protein [Croceibacterium sp.]